MAEAAYCLVSDLLTGNIPTPDYLSPQKYVDDAADEIDSKIGFVYQTRVDVSDLSTVVRPARLLLKRVNVFLATGRLLLAVDAGGEDTQLHAYGASLIKEANLALQQIATGEIKLDGATPAPGKEEIQSGPLVYNEDSESNVSAFYDRIANPFYIYPPAEIWSHNDGSLVQ